MVVQTPEDLGLGIFRIPNKDDNALAKIITKDRDDQLREQLAKRSLYICEKHYREDQINRCKFFIINSDNHYR